jgi:hypothetical protein
MNHLTNPPMDISGKLVASGVIKLLHPPKKSNGALLKQIAKETTITSSSLKKNTVTIIKYCFWNRYLLWQAVKV